MFSKYFMYKQVFTSSASRHIYRFGCKRNVYWKSPKLSIHKAGNSGRADNGRRVIRSKASILHYTKSIQINYNYSRFGASFVSNFIFLPYKNKLLSLVRYSRGSINYQVTTENQRLLNLYYRSLFVAKHLLTSPTTPDCSTFFNRLIRFPNLSKICLIELVPGRGAQYCRSSGTISKILKIDRKEDICLIKLPSGRTKVFSKYAFATIGRVLFKEARNFTNSKAGYWRGLGFKPTVRGVAMNPVDHPHGGRTNSIKYPRTPWGKTTKFK